MSRRRGSAINRVPTDRQKRITLMRTVRRSWIGFWRLSKRTLAKRPDLLAKLNL